jgi:hypothetical protein
MDDVIGGYIGMLRWMTAAEIEVTTKSRDERRETDDVGDRCD